MRIRNMFTARNNCIFFSFILANTAIPALSAEQLLNGNFEGDTAPWWGSSNITPSLVDGQLCADIPGGTANPWDVIIGQDNVILNEGEDYRFSFSASGNPGGPIRALVQMPVDPWTSYVTLTPQAGEQATDYSESFSAPVSLENAQVAFQVGGSADPWTLCFTQVSLEGGVEIEAYKADTGPALRVNQLGYLPDGPKKATLASNETSALDWVLLDAGGVEITAGKTIPKGNDPSAGENVHVVDFSEVSTTGERLTLEVAGIVSHPFAIKADLYDELRLDALKYFYPVRSGIEIDGAIAGAAYARPAGHVGEAPNTGDTAVSCQPAEVSQEVYGEPWTCAYTLDVTGGWYDAGDHGKYVVNGGISTAQLLSTWERALILDGEAKAALEDGSLPVPEAGNGVPDILDEARWELEWMIKMVVPTGDPLVGMVHHKVHDNEWTGLPLMPHLDDKTRELHRPSTAATLNLAATAAQGSRLFKPYDSKFAATLLAEAKSAYDAAIANPAIYATPEDGASGGGPYNDNDVSDEFYWAAAELFITTGEDRYFEDLQSSPHWDGPIFAPNAFDWASVAGFARIQLATVPSSLPESARIEMQTSVIAGAERFLQIQAGQPFGHPYAQEVYDWGSSHLVIQNALVLAAAFDLTGTAKYRNGALEAMDYVLGRNALNISYVTGYGTHFAQNQHSRWFSAQLNTDLPHPPNGALAGGPNSSIQDPVAQRLFGANGCAAQKCYVDDIESWSTNEITINWNAALAQMASWLADQ